MSETINQLSSAERLSASAHGLEALLEQEEVFPPYQRLRELFAPGKALLLVNPDVADEAVDRFLDHADVQPHQRELITELRGWLKEYFILPEDERIMHGDVIRCFAVLGIAKEVLGEVEIDEEIHPPGIQYGIIAPGAELHTNPAQRETTQQTTLRRENVTFPSDLETEENG